MRFCVDLGTLEALVKPSCCYRPKTQDPKTQHPRPVPLTFVPILPARVANFPKSMYNIGAFDLGDVSSISAPQRDLPAELCSIQRKIRKKEIATQWKQEQ
jgi:hypothetical protein